MQGTPTPKGLAGAGQVGEEGERVTSAREEAGQALQLLKSHGQCCCSCPDGSEATGRDSRRLGLLSGKHKKGVEGSEKPSLSCLLGRPAAL